MDAGRHSVLEVRNLTVSYASGGQRRRALTGASLQVFPGEVYGLVGESGSGKTTLAFAVLGLIDPPDRIEGGEVIFEGRPLLGLSERELDRVRGGRIGMVFQNALASLNPTFSVGAQVAEVLQVHLGLRHAAASDRASEWLGRVGLAGLERAYPHQLSGGQAQRAMIAIAMAPQPRLLIADEPTSALDVTVQSKVMQLIRRLTGPAGITVLLITHDLGVLAQYAERVGVMYAGRIVEEAPVEQLFANPQHPYSRGMLESLGQLHRQRP